jgi:hypothetical protein
MGEKIDHLRICEDLEISANTHMWWTGIGGIHHNAIATALDGPDLECWERSWEILLISGLQIKLVFICWGCRPTWNDVLHHHNIN